MTWKRLDPWWRAEDFIGARVRRMNNEALGRPDITDEEGLVIGGDTFGVKMDGTDVYGARNYLTTPWHSTSKWYVDVNSLPEGFESNDILDDDPDHVASHSQDEWSPKQKTNTSLIEGYKT